MTNVMKSSPSGEPSVIHQSPVPHGLDEQVLLAALPPAPRKLVSTSVFSLHGLNTGVYYSEVFHQLGYETEAGQEPGVQRSGDQEQAAEAPG